MDTTGKTRLIICFINPKLGLDGWKKAKIFSSEKFRIKNLLSIDKTDTLTFCDSQNCHHAMDRYSQIIYYAPSIYSVYYLMKFWLHHYKYKGKATSILRVGYFPSKTHLINRRYYPFLKALTLEIISGFFFDKIYLVSGNRNITLLNPKKIEEIAQSVSKNSFAPLHEININKKKLVTFIGRLEAEKGAHLLELINIPNINITVVGDGSYKSQLITKNQLNFRGQLHQKQLSQLYAQSYAILNLSPSEGVPKTLIEACANGCFVIHFENAFEIPRYCNDFCIPIKHLNDLPSALYDAKKKCANIQNMSHGIKRIRKYYGE